MRPHLVVFSAPSFDQDLRFVERVEDLPIQELIPELADEGFDLAVLPRAARCDEERCHAEGLQPLSDHLGRELRTVI